MEGPTPSGSVLPGFKDNNDNNIDNNDNNIDNNDDNIDNNDNNIDNNKLNGGRPV